MRNNILIFILVVFAVNAKAGDYIDSVINGNLCYKIKKFNAYSYGTKDAMWLMVRSVDNPQWDKVTIYYELLDSNGAPVFKPCCKPNPIITNWDSIQESRSYPYRWVETNLFGGKLKLETD